MRDGRAPKGSAHGEKERDMSKKLFVGSLSWDTNDEGLRNAFAVHGEISEAVVISDRDTGRSRGFAFVEMADASAALAAIEGLNGREQGGRALKVNEAKPKREGGGGGGRGRDW